MKKRFQNIKPRVLVTHILVTLLYPLARTIMSRGRKRRPRRRARLASRDGQELG